MFRTAADVMTLEGHQVRAFELYVRHFNPVSGRHDFITVKGPDYFKQQIEEMHAIEAYCFAVDVEEESQKLEYEVGIY